MEEFYPSEVARLVLGYLDEVNCKRSWSLFMEESSSLLEYLNLYKSGKKYTTNVNGNSLLDILKEYCSLKKEAREKDHFCKDQDKVVDKVFQNSVHSAIQQHLPLICRSNSGNSDDFTSINQMNEMKSPNDKEIGNTIPQETSHENVTFSSPQITNVISVCDLNSSKGISSIKQNLIILEDDPMCLLETIKIEDIEEPMHLQETPKVEDNIEKKYIPNDNINGTIGKECETARPLSDSLSKIQSSNELVLNSANNVGVENVIKPNSSLNDEMQSHHSIEKGDNVVGSVNTDNGPLCDENNLEVDKNSNQCPVSKTNDVLSSIVQSTVFQADANSSSSQFAYAIPTIANDTFSHQLPADSVLPKYYWSSVPNNCYFINTTSNNNVPLVGTTGLPVNNASNPSITSVDSRSNGILSYAISIPTIVENRSYSNAVAVNETESVKEKDKVNSTSKMRLLTAQSSSTDKPPNKKAASQKNKAKKNDIKKTPELKVKHTRKTYSRRKFISPYPPSSL